MVAGLVGVTAESGQVALTEQGKGAGVGAEFPGHGMRAGEVCVCAVQVADEEADVA